MRRFFSSLLIISTSNVWFFYLISQVVVHSSINDDSVYPIRLLIYKKLIVMINLDCSHVSSNRFTYGVYMR